MKPSISDRLPIKLDWISLIPLMGRANRTLANFNGTLFSLPNPDVLLSPLTTREAVLSSRIEGTQATLGDVMRFEAGEEPAEQSRDPGYPRNLELP
jgi:Fic family protein